MALESRGSVASLGTRPHEGPATSAARNGGSGAGRPAVPDALACEVSWGIHHRAAQKLGLHGKGWAPEILERHDMQELYLPFLLCCGKNFAAHAWILSHTTRT